MIRYYYAVMTDPDKWWKQCVCAHSIEEARQKLVNLFPNATILSLFE